ncbi:UPF0481 protein At3g47200-like [Pistacia vera]|uniref:UPF0481 protein At3g47200-like n=1 Tax=Pistacia vera TaxID=55513 RepID=UPI0012636A99|nr:UPF0481 protein At3g47200-like [Pistacia vera]XP_031250337.1 UPF0481 protein At3g47200-like [Pistacia vera]XP_031250338.1 UPF0481 protein At3g47200-like [Pistacia vera]
MANRIDNIVERLKDLTSTPTGRNIFKVPDHLRSVNPSAYDPFIIAIGPYHRDKEDFSMMEDHKMRFMKHFLERNSEREEEVKKYVDALRTLEKEARNHYADVAECITSDEFLSMMLLDGCFIVELLRRFMEKLRPRTGSNDNRKRGTLFSGLIIKRLGRDLLLVENQLPFCVLQKLFSMTAREGNSSLEDMILCFFSYSVFPDPRLSKSYTEIARTDSSENKHLLSFIRDKWLLRCPRKVSGGNDRAKEICWGSISCGNYSGSINCSTWRIKPPPSQNNGKFNSNRNTKNMKFMRCATELKEAGIKFRKGKEDSLFAIKFKNGVMEIPRLEIRGETESIFRNLIVYENYSTNENEINTNSRHVISDYMKFMDCLIDSQNDVELLCRCNILHNCLGDDKTVANMFNSIGDFVTLSPDNYFFDIFIKVNEHCGQKRHKWIAHLKHRYFYSPWAFISFFAAVLLLLFTLTQTVYSVLTYHYKE